MEVLGVGFALHADPEALRIARPLIEEDADYFEVSPETLWRPKNGGLERNAFHDVFATMKERSGRPFVGHGLAFSLAADLDEDGEAERTAAWLAQIADSHHVFQFQWYSEHLGFTREGGRFAVLPLPLPFTVEAVHAVADRLRRLATVVPTVAFETSGHVFLPGTPGDEGRFVRALAATAPSSILLDLHNLYVQATNLRFDPQSWLMGLDLSQVLQIHLSGGSQSEAEWLPSGRTFRIDTHDGPVPEPVWKLAEWVVPRCANLRGIVLERLNGTFGEEDLPELRQSMARAKALLARRGTVPAPTPPVVDLAHLPEGPDLRSFRRDLVSLTTGPGFSPATARTLLGIDTDALLLTRQLVRKLRFERLTMGDARLLRWFESESEAFVGLFRKFEAEVPPRAYFPVDEARRFHRWLRERGQPLPTTLEPDTP